MRECFYCHPEIFDDQQVILDNEFCMYLQLVAPDIEGSGIIVPRQHKETVFDLNEEEWRATYELLQLAKTFTDKKYKPDGYNIGWNCGEVGGVQFRRQTFSFLVYGKHYSIYE